MFTEAVDVEAMKQLVYHVNETSSFGEIWIACEGVSTCHRTAEYLQKVIAVG